MKILNEKPEEGLEAFVGEFLESRLQDIDRLSSHIAGSEFMAIADLAHNWKGFSRPYGFIKLEEIAQKLEKFAKAQDLENCREMVEEAKIYLQLKADQA